MVYIFFSIFLIFLTSFSFLLLLFSSYDDWMNLQKIIYLFDFLSSQNKKFLLLHNSTWYKHSLLHYVVRCGWFSYVWKRQLQSLVVFDVFFRLHRCCKLYIYIHIYTYIMYWLYSLQNYINISNSI